MSRRRKTLQAVLVGTLGAVALCVAVYVLLCYHETTRPGVVTRPSTSGTVYTVRPGDSLYTISRDVLGSGSRWPEILATNKDALSAGALQPGMEIRLPPADQ